MINLSSTSVDDELATAATTGSGEAMPPAAGGPTDLGRGAIVGRYLVLSKLGAGGMGVVFVAFDPELDRKVALKLLHPRLAADANPATVRDARARLVREAQALAKLNHPHIVAIHDVGEHQGTVWLAMEYVDGETLSAWLKQQRRTWREVLDVMDAAARGLSAAHNAGLVHRDIKPDNIMIGVDRVRVMDLGLARALGGDDDSAGFVSADAPTAAAQLFEALAVRVTQAGAVMGTPAYMSPEQYRGQPADARADVFSFCVTLWEALMGERPFAGNTLVEFAANVLSGTVRPVPLDPHAQRVPGWLRRVCTRGLAVDPERRFDSMEALLDALSQESTIDSAPARRARRVFLWSLGAALVATSVPALLADGPPPIEHIIALPIFDLVILTSVIAVKYKQLIENPKIWNLIFLVFTGLVQCLVARILAAQAGLSLHQYIPIDHVIILGFVITVAYYWIPKMWIGVALVVVSGSLTFVAPALFWKAPVIVYPLVGLLVIVWWPEKLTLSKSRGTRQLAQVNSGGANNG